MITKCKACEIEANDELVKQMPLHTCGKDGPIENAMPKTADKHTPMDYKQFEGHTPEKHWMHYQLYDAISKIPNGLDFLKAVNEGISENRSLKLELQKQKELNAELVRAVENALKLHWLSYEDEGKLRSLIKKSNEI